MSCLRQKKNHAQQLLSLIVATAMLTGVFAVTSYSGTRSESFSAAKTNAATVSRTQPQTPALKYNGKIAFTSQRDANYEIYTMNPDGSNQTRLTNNPAEDSGPAWSPDGSMIAFTSNRDGNFEIYTMNLDGTNQKRITNTPADDINPDWSPDGAKIAFSSDRNGNEEIYVMNADGTDQTRLTSNPGVDRDPAFSPDGTRIAFQSQRDIYVMNADGSNPAKLTHNSTDPFVVIYTGDPAWSPDGSKIAFWSYYDLGGFCEIFGCTLTISIMSDNGTVKADMENASGFSPAWSPDGTKIAFGNGNVRVMDPDGTNVTSLTSTTPDLEPAWQPPLSAPGPNTVQFSSASYTVSEGSPRVDITLSRSGDTTRSAAVSFATSDGAGLNNCDMVNGIASPRCDYTNTSGTVQFAAGDTSKSFSVAIVDDSYAEGNETFTVSLSGAADATLGTQSAATVTIIDNDSTNGVNPIDSTDFFVRQQYIDFLGREPDPDGFTGWTSTINNCTGDTTQCDRTHVSQLFFQSEEFQSRGYFVYRFYPVAFGRKPDYAEFIPDLARVSGFLTDAQLEAAKVRFIADFMARPAFANTYNGLSDQQYVVMLTDTAGVTLPNRGSLIDGLALGTLTRAAVLRKIVESPEVSTKYNHQAFAVMEYFGYLRRQPDAFYLDWILALDQSNDPRGMVSGFVSSAEYRQRFGL